MRSESSVFFLNLLRVESIFLIKDSERGSSLRFKWHRLSVDFTVSILFWNKCVFIYCIFRKISRCSIIIGSFFQTLNFLFCIGGIAINNVVVVSDEQLKDSAIHIHVSFLPQIPIPSRLPHNIE